MSVDWITIKDPRTGKYRRVPAGTQVPSIPALPKKELSLTDLIDLLGTYGLPSPVWPVIKSALNIVLSSSLLTEEQKNEIVKLRKLADRIIVA